MEMYFTSFHHSCCVFEEIWEGMEGYPALLATLPPGFLCDAAFFFLGGKIILEVEGLFG